MEERREYDVLKLVEHGERCYMSTDYMKGMPLIRWLKYHPSVTKDGIYRWMNELLESLDCFHRCRGNPCYQYLNPYSLIVSEDGKLYLLDLGSKDQKEMLHLMQRRSVRENFLSPENRYYQKASVREDIYGFGKTIQYLLSAAEIEPCLGRVEEKRLQHIIARCVNQNSKKSYQTIRELSEHFPGRRYDRNHKLLNKRKRILMLTAVIVIGILAAWTANRRSDEMRRDAEEKRESGIEEAQKAEGQPAEEEGISQVFLQKEIQWEEQKKQMEEEFYLKERSLIYELALICFAELEDYQRSREVLEKLEEQESFDKDFIKLCGYLAGETIPAADREMEFLLNRMEKEIPNEEDFRYSYCILKGYQRLEGQEAENSAVRLAKACLESGTWRETAEISQIEELEKIAGGFSEKEGQNPENPKEMESEE